MQLRRVTPTTAEWDELDGRPGRLLFQTRAWLEFVEATCGAQRVVAEVVDGSDVRGHFFGLTTKAFGLRMVGSPLAGWTTAFLGFDVDDDACRTDLLRPLSRFAFRELGAVYVEMRDRHMVVDEVPFGQIIGALPVLQIDLRRTEDEIFAAMTSAARRCVRKAEKCGVVIEECTGDDDFADDYYAQLRDVFAKQQLVPTYGVDRVRALIRHVGPTGSLLLLRARDADGRSIATGIFPGKGGTAYFWGGASWREHQQHRPNEAIMWHAIRTWKARGAAWLDLGGGGEYKLKYRPDESAVPTWAAARVPGLVQARHGFAALVAARQRRRGRAVAAGTVDE